MKIKFYVVKNGKVCHGPYSHYKAAEQDVEKGCRVYATDTKGVKNIQQEIKDSGIFG